MDGVNGDRDSDPHALKTRFVQYTLKVGVKQYSLTRPHPVVPHSAVYAFSFYT